MVQGAEHDTAGEVMWIQMNLSVAQAMRVKNAGDFVKTGNPNGGPPTLLASRRDDAEKPAMDCSLVNRSDQRGAPKDRDMKHG